MYLGLDGKTAAVCASSRGLGRAVALGLAQEGASVSLCSRNEANIQAAAEAIGLETGAPVRATAADLSVPDDAKRFLRETREAFGRIDILVTNAGGPPPGGFDDTPAESFHLAHRLTLMSAVHLMKDAAPEMKERRWGRIINMTSLSVKQPIDSLILSNTARAAVVAFAKTAANALAPYNVTVNNLCPGIIYTDRIAELTQARAEANGSTPEEETEKLKADIPMGRLGEPAEFANAAVFLASEAASYITGATLQIDGGAVKSLL